MPSRTSAQPALPAGEQAAPDEPARSRRRTGRSRETLAVRVLQVSLGVTLLGLWQLAAARKWPDPVLAKSPVQSWDYLAGAARSGALWTNTRSTMTAVLIAWVLAGLAGVAAGLALGLMPRTERVLSRYLDAANAMPRIALAPLLIVALGIGALAKVALASTLVFFIVLSGARAGGAGPPTWSGCGCRRCSAPGNTSCSSRCCSRWRRRRSSRRCGATGPGSYHRACASVSRWRAPGRSIPPCSSWTSRSPRWT